MWWSTHEHAHDQKRPARSGLQGPVRPRPGPSSPTLWSATNGDSPFWWAPSASRPQSISAGSSRGRASRTRCSTPSTMSREAEIIKLAGQRNTVTIATNMAGRGTDIVLGEGVVELGGLHVIGTERHESRRIDNQLRGRSGRQGDPGFVSVLRLPGR